MWLSKHKEGSHPEFCMYMQEHSGLWKISVFTILVVNIVKTKLVPGAGNGVYQTLSLPDNAEIESWTSMSKCRKLKILKYSIL